MDDKALVILRADVEGQMALINDVFDKLTARTADLQAGNEVQLESGAYQLHNLYGAVEELTKIIAGHFENQITDVSRWHIEILRRMKQEIPGVRPALLSPDSFALLNSLRSFRHFFRHAYNAPIEYEQLKINLEKAKQLHPVLERDVKRFMNQMVGPDGLGE